MKTILRCTSIGHNGHAEASTFKRRRRLPLHANRRAHSLLFLLALAFCSSSHAFTHQAKQQRQQTKVSAVQLDDRKTRQRTPLEQQQQKGQESTASQLDELFQRSANVKVLSEELDIADRIEIHCHTDEGENSDSDADEEPSEADTKSETESDTNSSSEKQAKDDDLEEIQKRRKLAARAALLGRSPTAPKTRKPGATTNRKAYKSSTSVGERRIGSTSKARQGPDVTKKIMDAVRKSASSNTSNDGNNELDTPPSKDTPSASIATKRKLSPSRLHERVLELMAPFPQRPEQPVFQSKPPPGSILIPSSPKVTHRDSNKLQFPECLTVRVATPRSDTEVANLRLSVFSDFTPDVRRQLVSRSVRAVVTRRSLGATCLIATVPPSLSARKRNRPPVILGSAECSFHEFDSTTLGRCRPVGSILYVTEVAVSPNARRRGIGAKLIEAIDVLANTRGIETLYLHVDVENEGALSLYQKAGFRKVDRSDPMFLEFTTKLNLHDGATKGRNHFLLYKDLVECPTWLAQPPTTVPVAEVHPVSTNFSRPPPGGTLGFEVLC
ncbi:FR47-like protein [Seminavis robusta]|uniref:FR47-like protein n=1 Tax=Seminavis robusta TaxID=568900 RepID=A0A9N8F2E5_9STRA|nr:FR47-like protein [Seminavis robusta]|eukprot:Sro2715_g335350.1 FR47-like protein (555) ;mRNA; f:1930-3773